MRDTELSPRRVLSYLSPRLPLDAPVVGEWRLFDAYRLSTEEPLSLELRRSLAHGVDTLRVSVEPEPAGGFAHRPVASVAGLGLSYRSRSPGEAGVAACAALAKALAAELGPHARRWQLREPGLTQLAEDIATEVEFEPAAAGRDPDAALLQQDFDHYARLYGARPEFRRVRVRGTQLLGVSVHYPAAQNGTVPNSAAVYPTPMRIAHRRRMRRYFGTLGCVFNADAEARTVPTPTAYTRALREREGLAAVRPRMIQGLSANLLPVHWGAFVQRNILPVTVAPSWAVRVHAHRRNIGPLAGIPCDVGMLVHDMGLHALALHAVPAPAWDELAGTAIARVRAQPQALLLGRFGLLARLAAFFEGPVTTACWRSWAEVDEPEHFATSFEPHFAELMRELHSL